MGACGEMADWDLIGGMSGVECRDFHIRKVTKALEGNKRRIDSQCEFWCDEKMLPLALTSSKRQSVVAWFMLSSLGEDVAAPDDADGLRWLDSNVSDYTKAVMGQCARGIGLEATDKGRPRGGVRQNMLAEPRGSGLEKI
jgi:hypothetical protein